MSDIDLTDADRSTILFALNHWACDIQRMLKKPDDGLHASRRDRIDDLQELADRLQERGA